MAISNSAVLAGLLAKLPSFCSFPSSPSLCLCLFRNTFIPTLLTPSSLPTSPPGGPTAHPKKLLGSSFPHLARGSEAQQVPRCCAGKCNVARAPTHACSYRPEIDRLAPRYRDAAMRSAVWPLKLLTPFITFRNGVNLHTLAQRGEG